MSDSLKSRLNQIAAEANAAEGERKAATERYHEAARLEYPRLLDELLTTTQRLLDGVNGLTFAVQHVEQTLTQMVGSVSWSSERGHEDNRTKEIVGKVTVPDWTISFLDRTMSFRGAGIDYIGVHGKIDIQTSHANPFARQGVFMASKRDDPYKWFLALASEGPRPESTLLTDEVLSGILEKYFAAGR